MKFWKRVRDSITGRFVRKEEAKRRPATTIEETVVIQDGQVPRPSVAELPRKD